MIYQKEKLFDLNVDKSSMKFLKISPFGSGRNFWLWASDNIFIFSLTFGSQCVWHQIGPFDLLFKDTRKIYFIASNTSRKPLTSLRPISVLLMLMMTKMRLVEWTSNSNWVLCPFHKNGPAVIWTDRVGCKKSFKKGNYREENWWTHVEF